MLIEPWTEKRDLSAVCLGSQTRKHRIPGLELPTFHCIAMRAVTVKTRVYFGATSPKLLLFLYLILCRHGTFTFVNSGDTDKMPQHASSRRMRQFIWVCTVCLDNLVLQRNKHITCDPSIYTIYHQARTPPPKNKFLISQPKHMLWVLKRTVSMRRLFWAPKIYAKADGLEIINTFMLKNVFI